MRNIYRICEYLSLVVAKNVFSTERVAVEKSLSTTGLEKLAEDSSTTCDTRSEATIPLQNILIFSFIILIHFWYEILRRIDYVQLRLQDTGINFKEAFHDLESLAEIRNKFLEKATEKTKYLYKIRDNNATIRIRRSCKIYRVMKNIVDRLQQEICILFTRLSNLNFKFEFLLHVKNLLNKKNVNNNTKKIVQI